ncbi:hypothetical protein [Aureimonas populi]|uniref:Uncharacterized protein n=1 Tax=Aureimonas populi TaxID=1701758 RepID=A0ABW5CMN4_9HYPH|nr:hypothetical protein [Aureimonas populi]
MSRTPDDPRETDKILPEPVREDGIVSPEDRRPESDIDDKDGGLAGIGGGDPSKRKII